MRLRTQTVETLRGLGLNSIVRAIRSGLGYAYGYHVTCVSGGWLIEGERRDYIVGRNVTIKEKNDD